MDRQEHIATLCAAGTVGIAAAGFALGTQIQTADLHLTAPGKRKWPGASFTKQTSFQTPIAPRRTVSQPGTTVRKSPEGLYTPLSAPALTKPNITHIRPSTAVGSTPADSRGSSLNRSSILRPRTADTRSTSERRDPSTGSSWLKRISTISTSYNNSPAPSILHHLDEPSTTEQPPEEKPRKSKKLVKRAASQRGLSSDTARGFLLRRPATSHQRTTTLRDWNLNQNSSSPAAIALSAVSPVAESPVIGWKPFFDRGYPRKRHSSIGLREVETPRTVTTLHGGQPTLLLGSSVESSEYFEDCETRADKPPAASSKNLTSRQRLTRSFSTMHKGPRRRYFTDPLVKVTNESANGTFSPAIRQSPLSPMSDMSKFDIDMPVGTPVFSSSPPVIPNMHRFSLRKRESTAPSDPTTVSSDNDTRVFTDDDSMDFQSDTAYDSVATRVTTSSHSAMRQPKLDTIFNNVGSVELHADDADLDSMMQNVNLNESHTTSNSQRKETTTNHGIGITGLEGADENSDVRNEGSLTLTPIRSNISDDYMMTPMRSQEANTLLSTEAGDFDLPCGHEFSSHSALTDATMLKHMEDVIDWSPKSEAYELDVPVDAQASLICSSPVDAVRGSNGTPGNGMVEHSDQRALLFDWSEHQRGGTDLTNGIDTRPKTVHGKQGADGIRSRSSGRKGQSHLHLRSQSVPNNRDPNAEPMPSSATKYGTWGLGHKPVSEEWSDDFEFDDVEEVDESPQAMAATLNLPTRGSVRVPQAIIDRQASVHIQFGQVQEFMLLVEELKRLRARGTVLQLLNASARKLWEDAESIINLATINDEEDMSFDQQLSSTPSDFQGDDISIAGCAGRHTIIQDEQSYAPVSNRHVSSPETPSSTRPRTESLVQAKNFLQTIHQTRGGQDSSPLHFDDQQYKKLPFDTQDLKDLVAKSGVITRALKDVIRKAEGVSISPSKTPPRIKDPAFSQIFNVPDSPCPPCRKPGLPKSKSANSYLSSTFENNNTHGDVGTSTTTLTLTAMV